MTGIDATVASDGRSKVAVFSHERSGTHFMMNTLAACFGYVSDPWWNLDFEQGLNFHAPAALEGYLRRAHGVSVLNVVKSHHQAGFLEPLIDYLTDEFRVFYVCRDPLDTLVSYWRLVRDLPWDEGPVTGSVAEFVRSAPRGGCLRYQKSQAATMLHRWRDHVEGWLDLAELAGPSRVRVVQYEHLHRSFEPTVRAVGEWMGTSATALVRPGKDRNVIGAGEGRVGAHVEHLSAEDEAWAAGIVARTKARVDSHTGPTGPDWVTATRSVDSLAARDRRSFP